MTKKYNFSMKVWEIKNNYFHLKKTCSFSMLPLVVGASVVCLMESMTSSLYRDAAITFCLCKFSYFANISITNIFVHGKYIHHIYTFQKKRDLTPWAMALHTEAFSIQIWNFSSSPHLGLWPHVGCIRVDLGPQ